MIKIVSFVSLCFVASVVSIACAHAEASGTTDTNPKRFDKARAQAIESESSKAGAELGESARAQLGELAVEGEQKVVDTNPKRFDKARAKAIEDASKTRARLGAEGITSQEPKSVRVPTDTNTKRYDQAREEALNR